MKGTPAIYLGNVVEKKNFRAFIYGPNGQRRLVESWEEFEANMQTGVWFATKEEAEEPVSVVKDVEKQKAKPRAKPKPKAKPEPMIVDDVNDSEEVLPDDDTVFEVTDDFLPDESK